MKNGLYSLLLIALLVGTTACTNEEGIGGKAMISGQVIVEVYDRNTQELLTSGPAPNERIYIIYGDNTGYDDDLRTSYDGTYKFEYLYKGSYQIYAYSECLFDEEDCPHEIYAETIDISISEVSEETEAPTLVIKRLE